MDAAREIRDDRSMCCFSPVAAPASFLARVFGGRSSAPVHVSDTSIFARAVGPSEQALVYSMELSALGDVAMILPVPVVAGAGDDALSFVDLSKFPGFFDDLRALFVVPMPAARSSNALAFAPQSRQVLKVHSVGAFEASFVPSMSDWDRIDPRFRLPDGVFQKLGGYDDYGFAVFKLAAGKKAKIHPMAFRFRTRAPERLFFPTVHVHDGEVHPRAHFDHALFFQGGALESAERAFLKPSRDVEGLVDVGAPMLRRTLHGSLPNEDTWVARAD